MPPAWAMAMARPDSVTVSIAADIRGRFRVIELVSRVRRSTALGMTSEWPGNRRTSSKVSASSMGERTMVAMKPTPGGRRRGGRRGRGPRRSCAAELAVAVSMRGGAGEARWGDLVWAGLLRPPRAPMGQWRPRVDRSVPGALTESDRLSHERQNCRRRRATRRTGSGADAQRVSNQAAHPRPAAINRGIFAETERSGQDYTLAKQTAGAERMSGRR